MKCQNCGSEVRDGAKFCRECGSEVIEKTEALNTNDCPVCGNILEQNAIFCNECGTRLTETTEDFTVNVRTCSCCGNRLNIDALFCGECGNAVNQSQLNDAMEDGKTVKKEDKGLRFLIVLLIIVLIGSATTIGYVYYQNSAVDIKTPDIDDEKEYKEYEEEFEEEIDSSLDVNDIDEDEEIYLFPSDIEYITLSDLYGMSQEEVALIRNEIYARHGYIFNTEPFKSYFEAKDWYVPNPSFSDSTFNEIEKANKDFIVNYETEKGWR